MITTYLIELMNHGMLSSSLNKLMLDVMASYRTHQTINIDDYEIHERLTDDELVVLSSLPLYLTDCTADDLSIFEEMTYSDTLQVIKCWISILKAVDEGEEQETLFSIVDESLISLSDYIDEWRSMLKDVIQLYNTYDACLDEIGRTESYLKRMLLVEMLSITIETDYDMEILVKLYLNDDVKAIMRTFIECVNEETQMRLNDFTLDLIDVNERGDKALFIKALQNALDDDAYVYLRVHLTTNSHNWMSLETQVKDDKEMLVAYTDYALIKRCKNCDVIPLTLGELFMSIKREEDYDGIILNPHTEAEAVVVLGALMMKVDQGDVPA